MKLRNYALRLGLVILIGLILLMTVGPFLVADPLEINVKEALSKPNTANYLGTDLLGRDVLARIVYGGRISFLVSMTAAAGSLLVGLLVGVITGWVGGITGSALDLLLETLLCIPGIMLALMIVMFIGPGINGIIVALTLSGSIYIARLVKAEVQVAKSSGYIEAALLAGLPLYRVIIFHLLPNIVGPVTAYSAVLVGTNILAESGLSFLGLGVQPPEPSWGVMLFEARNLLGTAPWLALSPGVAIFTAVLGINLLSDGLRNHFDPKRKTISVELEV